MNKKLRRASKKSEKKKIGKPARKTEKNASNKSKSAKKPAASKLPPMEKPIGKVTHFYGNIKVAIVKFNKAVPVGTTLHYRGVTTDFSDTIKSMQFNHESVKIAKKNKLIGIKVKKQVRQGDKVYPGKQ
jgi:putative protease